MLAKLLCLGVLALAATAQNIPHGVKYDLTDLAYPRLGRLTQVQGVVKLELIPTEAGQEVKLVSGNGMLVRQASDNLAKWRTDQPLTVNYIFRLAPPEIEKVRVPKGDAFDRLLLRMLHLSTHIEETRCLQTSSSSESKVTEPKVVLQSPLTLELEIVVQKNCLLMVESSLLASR